MISPLEHQQAESCMLRAILSRLKRQIYRINMASKEETSIDLNSISTALDDAEVQCFLALTQVTLLVLAVR